MIHKNQKIELTVDAISSDGNGVGRYEGFVVFVPHSAAGDRLLVHIVKVAKTHAFAVIHQIITPSPHRIENECPSFRRCGGCAFRHLDYTYECAVKWQFVVDAMSRIGHFHELRINDTIPSPVTDRYRNKVQLPVFSDENGRLKTGFFAPRSHRLVPFEAPCMLEPENLSHIAKSCCNMLGRRGVAAYDEANHNGLLRHIVLRESSLGGSVLLCLVCNGDRLPDEAGFVADITTEHPEIATIVLNANRGRTNVIFGGDTRTLFGDGYLFDRLAGVDLRLSARSFFQVNHAAAEQLYRIVRDYAAPGPGDRLLDIYCGAGAIGLSMARDVGEVVGIESLREAVGDATFNTEYSGIQNARFIAADAGLAATQLLADGARADIVITDPPRKGCAPETIDAVVALQPERIVMVSCNAATLARDLAVLAERGYAVAEITPVDLFPRTPHVECVALLKR